MPKIGSILAILEEINGVWQDRYAGENVHETCDGRRHNGHGGHGCGKHR